MPLKRQSCSCAGWACAETWSDLTTPVYMSVQVAANPSSLQLITKRLYRETAKQFHTTSIAVERAVRTVIGDCWKLEDHSLLDTLAGRHLTRSPSNSVFIDLVAGYLRYPLS